VLAGSGSERIAAWAGNRLCQVEQRMVFPLAEVLGLKQFGQAYNLRAPSRSVTHALECFAEILFRLRSAGHLHQRYAKFVRRQATNPPTG
jgi:hypothetical protein